jgi:hypothetical protein
MHHPQCPECDEKQEILRFPRFPHIPKERLATDEFLVVAHSAVRRCQPLGAFVNAAHNSGAVSRRPRVEVAKAPPPIIGNKPRRAKRRVCFDCDS